MRYRAYVVLFVAVTMLLLALTACGSAEPVTDGNVGNNQYGVVTVKTDDGRTVECVIWDGRRAGGLDCNWPDAE